MKPVRVGDYCTVINKKVKESGLKVGQEVLIVTLKPAPEKRSDPYLQRIYVGVLEIKDDEVLIPNGETGEGDNGYRVYIVDPRHLEKLPEERVAELEKKLGEKMEANEATN